MRPRLLRAAAAVGACSLIVLTASATAEKRTSSFGGDWTRFGYDAARSDAGPARTGITAKNVRRLVERRVELDGTVDSSPVYLRDALVGGRRHSVFIVTTSDGKAIALDAASGRSLWRFVPPHLASWEGTYRITTSSPVADPGGQFVYSAAPDGFVYKLRVANGASVGSGGWPARITMDPSHEKISSALNLSGNLLLATTASFADIGAYQGHVVAIDRRSGRLVNVWNALCSKTRRLLVPDTCALSGAGIWGRSGVVVQPGTGNLIVTTGNGAFDGVRTWGNSVVILSPNAGHVIGSWTPVNWQQLAADDLDLGSTAPALLTPTLAVQGGKDGLLRLLDLRPLERKPLATTRVEGHELQVFVALGGGVYSTPAVWHDHEQTWLFVMSQSGFAGYKLVRRRLVRRWLKRVPGFPSGTSPVIAGGLLYVNDTGRSRLEIFQPTSGKQIAALLAGPGHWNSPIVTDGRVALAEGNATDDLQTTGTLDIYSLPRPG